MREKQMKTSKEGQCGYIEWVEKTYAQMFAAEWEDFEDNVQKFLF